MIEFNEPVKHLSEMPIFELITSYRETNQKMQELSVQYLYIADTHKERYEKVIDKYNNFKTDIAIEIADRISKDA